MKELQESLARHLEKERRTEEKIQKTEHVSEPENVETDFPFVPSDELAEAIIGFFCAGLGEAEREPCMPYADFIGAEPVDLKKVMEVLGGGPSTVKTLAGELTDIPSPRIGVVVSFQACLPVESERRVVLEQHEDDVAVKSALQ